MNMSINDGNAEVYLRELSRIKIDRIFIAFERDAFYSRNKERKVFFDRLKKNYDLLTKAGYSVGIWIQAYGFGTELPGSQIELGSRYTRLRSVLGYQSKTSDAICPECDEFINDYTDFIKEIAKIGSDMIMLDDDFCMSVRPGLGCFCDKHLELLEQELGEKLELKDIKTLFFTGGENKYRDAYLKVMKNSNVKFATAVRSAVDMIDNSIRLGFCAGFTSWDIEGIDALELTKILAGENKPFLRFTSAPYWVAKPINRFRGQSLAGVIEEARAQESFCRGSGVDVFIEADSYPRPRYMVPSTLIECFSLPMHASGGVNELAYLIDYISSPGYETGYIDHRVYNKSLYDFVKKNFDGKTCCGVKVYNEMHKLRTQDICKTDTEYDIMSSHFNRGAEFLAINGIPTCYEETAECGAAFGENARHLKTLCKKMIVDAKGAKILTEKGYDLGFTDYKINNAPVFERFGDEKILLTYGSCLGYYNFTLKNNARVLSVFESDNSNYPSAYTYRSNGVEFLVLCFDVGVVPYQAAVLRSYLRAEQLREFCGKFPKIVKSNCMYQICKKGDDKTALLFSNLSENPVINGEIMLDDKYSDMEICGIKGVLLGDKIKLCDIVHPFQQFAIVLK